MIFEIISVTWEKKEKDYRKKIGASCHSRCTLPHSDMNLSKFIFGVNYRDLVVFLEEVWPFSEEWAWVNIGMKFGFIYRREKFFIVPPFDEVGDF
jgi:hypothetical protein